MAGFLTFKKALLRPETESWRAFAVSAIGFLSGVLAILVSRGGKAVKQETST